MNKSALPWIVLVVACGPTASAVPPTRTADPSTSNAAEIDPVVLGERRVVATDIAACVSRFEGMLDAAIDFRFDVMVDAQDPRAQIHMSSLYTSPAAWDEDLMDCVEPVFEALARPGAREQTTIIVYVEGGDPLGFMQASVVTAAGQHPTVEQPPLQLDVRPLATELELPAPESACDPAVCFDRGVTCVVYCQNHRVVRLTPGPGIDVICR